MGSEPQYVGKVKAKKQTQIASGALFVWKVV